MMYDALALERQRIEQDRLRRRVAATTIGRAVTEARDASSELPRPAWLRRLSVREWGHFHTSRAACVDC